METKNNQQSKSKKMVAKRTAEVWRRLPADNSNTVTATAMAMQQAMEMWHWQHSNRNSNSCGCSIVEAEAKKSSIKKQKMAANRMADVWCQLPGHDGDAVPETAMEQAMAAQQW